MRSNVCHRLTIQQGHKKPQKASVCLGGQCIVERLRHQLRLAEILAEAPRNPQFVCEGLITSSISSDLGTPDGRRTPQNFYL
jgi:hypothetical protein